MAIVTQEQINSKEVTLFYYVGCDRGNLLGCQLSPYFSTEQEARAFKDSYQGSEEAFLCRMESF
ncbi:hypothetical protein J3998_12030 [Thiomicrorhabdus sp. 6S2-11]|uniref:WGR domain-containing protein n=1 Tax=Thiomicrorhabdus marina TaxID=2818442 RepID=A0ABS3Q7J3_9GAMM|nr:hypothetical protein [Thiomicrorhabdus marina]MBO1928302.1 hypothetical protein [Thiomicrorhabdus marina]